MAKPSIDTQQLAALAVFARVVEAGTFSAAARQLGHTKSAVSKQVQKLETEFGARLLHRTTRKLSLTEQGRIVYDHAEQIVRLSSAARDALAQLAERPSGVLRMTTSVTYGRHVLAPLLPEFFALYPQIRLALTLVDRYVDLADEGYDLAIRLTEQPAEHLAGRRLHRCDFALCATPEFAARHPVAQPADLATLPCLSFTAGAAARGTTWRFTDAAGKGVSVEVQGPVAVNSSDVVRGLTLQGLGIGLLPCFTVAQDLEQGRLVRLLPHWQPAGAFGPTAWALWLPQRRMVPKLRVMIDFLVARLGGQTN
jgi:DNA-binding transcriptional LysR family regulator